MENITKNNQSTVTYETLKVPRHPDTEQIFADAHIGVASGIEPASCTRHATKY